jgi:hypothetical protein
MRLDKLRFKNHIVDVEHPIITESQLRVTNEDALLNSKPTRGRHLNNHPD